MNTHEAKLCKHGGADTFIPETANTEWQRQANTQERGECVNER